MKHVQSQEKLLSFQKYLLYTLNYQTKILVYQHTSQGARQTSDKVGSSQGGALALSSVLGFSASGNRPM